MHNRARVVLGALLLSLVGCATVHPSPRNLTMIAGKVTHGGHSGSAFKYRGFLVTAGHICASVDASDPEAPVILSYMRDGQETFGGYFQVRAYVSDGVRDACILTPSGALRHAPLESLSAARSLTVGEAVSIVGAPWGQLLFRTDGYVAALELGDGYLGVSAASAPGNSGSPVVNSAGEVIGLLAAGTPLYSNISFVTPIRVVDELIDAPHPN